MSWVRIEHDLARHRRIRELNVNAKWLYVVALCYCCDHLTDGLIDQVALKQIIADADIPTSSAKRAVKRLEDAGLWIRHDDRDGWLIRDYLDYQPTREDVKFRREQARNRMQHLRLVRANRQERFGVGS